MSILNKIGVTLIGALLFISCSDDLLDKKPLDAYSEVDVWGDIALTESYVNENYRALGLFTECLPASLSDESYFIHNHGAWTVNTGEVSPDNMSLYKTDWIVDTWEQNYSYIRNCNVFLEKIGDVPGDESTKERLTGEMKFIRAWCYADMLWRWGGVPLITKVFKLDDDFIVARNTYAECLDFILKELDEAASLLPETYNVSETNLGRATKAACMALKARTLLYGASKLNNPSMDQEKWRKAADANYAIIALNRWSLFDDYEQLFIQKNTVESILERQCNPLFAEHRMELWNGVNGDNLWGGNCPLHGLVLAYEMTNGESPVLYPPYTVSSEGLVTANVNPASGFDPQDPYKDRDPRFYATILYNGAPWRGRSVETFLPGGKDTKDGPGYWNTSKSGYFLRKFLVEDYVLGGAAQDAQQNYIIFRLGEFYLNYAECMYHLGDEATAREYLNKIRSRASVNMPPIKDNVTGEELYKKIQNERRIELAFEWYHRYIDVRRWMIAEQTENQPAINAGAIMGENGQIRYEPYVFQERAFHDFNYLLPIPRYEINSNKEISQNPGYN
ncbi:RagB/SusD family nutrient uptake outer membrane protein [Parabacteroides sp.]